MKILFGKKKQKLDKSLCKLHPNYSQELNEKKEHYARIFRRIAIVSIITICACSLALFIISQVVGVHETKYTLPSGEIITIDINAKVYLEGQRLKGIETNDNKILSFVSLGIFFSSFGFGLYYFTKDF